MPSWTSPDPVLVLAALAGCTALAGVLESAGRRRRKRQLRRLAAQWRMTYISRDRLRITEKISDRFPVPGAADLYVADVIYGSEGGQYRYIFTAEYTVGVVRAKRRQVRVAALTEARQRNAPSAPAELVLAPDELPVVEQYQKLAPSHVARAGELTQSGQMFD